jgi:hypothetical protein
MKIKVTLERDGRRELSMKYADDNDEAVCGGRGSTISTADELDDHDHRKASR